MAEIDEKVTDLQIRVTVVEKLISEHEARIDLQLGRLIADIESEKGTRLRLHADWKAEVEKLQRRLASLERHVAIGIGIIAALQVLVPLLFKFVRL